MGMMIINHQKKIFVGQRFDKDKSAWQMPQGGIDKGESEEVALKRELEEETGISKNFNIIKISEKKYTYDLPNSLQKKLWKGKYKGQEQRWFLLRFIGEDKEIDIQTKKPEFKKWKWIQQENLIDIIIPFKKKLYKNILKEFKNELI